MKLWQKIMLSVTGILLFCGLISGWLVGAHLRERQLSRAVRIERSNFQTAEEMLIRLYQTELYSDMLKEEAISQTVLDSLLHQEMFGGCLLLDENGIVSNPTEYEIAYDSSWAEKGRFERDDYQIEELDGEYLLVMGSRLPEIGKTVYLFSIRDLTDIYEDVGAFMRQFLLIWISVMIAASVLTAAAAGLVLSPLGKLEKAARAVSGGDYSHRVEIRRKDETGRLAAAFNIMEQEVRRQVEELRETGEKQKQLLGSLAHEIRTPMTSVIGYSDTLMHVKLDPESRQKALKHIYEQSVYLQRLSAKMMELSGLYQNEAIHLERCEIRQSLENAVWMAEKRWPDKSFWLLGEESFSVEGDPDLLLSLFVNLLDNAAKASAPGQEIRTEVFSEGRVSVRDFGKGIRPEELEKIREPFYTADPARKSGRGLGLGLAICEQIVRLHGAGLRIESSEGEGTEASVVFDLQFVYGTMKNSGTGSGTLETGKEELP